MLVRNAHNDLKNNFNLSLERMKQEFTLKQQDMEKQIVRISKTTENEKLEKKRLQEELHKLRNKQKEEDAKDELK
jgi:hypothetical protein